MSKKSDAAVGRLAVMEGVLNHLLRELVTETTVQDAKDLTTGKAAQALLGHAKHDSALLTPDVTDWLKRGAPAPAKGYPNGSKTGSSRSPRRDPARYSRAPATERNH